MGDREVMCAWCAQSDGTRNEVYLMGGGWVGACSWRCVRQLYAEDDRQWQVQVARRMEASVVGVQE